jgi:hypothetical protein
VAYLDASVDRSDAEFTRSVEAARLGTIFGHDQKAYERWARSTASTGKGLTGASLEQAVMNLALRAPEYIVHGPG